LANSINNGKHHTIRWYVDDVKSRDEDSKVNHEFLDWLKYANDNIEK